MSNENYSQIRSLKEYYQNLGTIAKWFFPKKLAEDLKNPGTSIEYQATLQAYRTFSNLGFFTRLFFSGLRRFKKTFSLSSFKAIDQVVKQFGA